MMTGCLIIHGYTGGPYEVEPLVDYLHEHTNWDIEVPTLPGHGETLALEDVTHDKWLQAAEDALRNLEEKNTQVYLIGFSMDGMIAAYLAAKFKVDKLVLLAPAGKVLSLKQLSLDVGEVITDGIKGNLQDNLNYQRYRKKVGKIPLRSNLEFLKLMKYTREYLKDIESQVFIAQGIQKGIVPASTASYLDKEITTAPQKEVVLFEKSDHLICWGEDKDTLNGMIHDFLLN